MAGRLNRLRAGQRYNCPTSNRDGITVSGSVERETLAEIDSVVGPLIPTDYDRQTLARLDARDRGAVWIPDNVDDETREALEADAQANVALEDMNGPSAADLAVIEAEERAA